MESDMLFLFARGTGVIYIFAGVSKIFSRHMFLSTVQTLPFLSNSSALLIAKTLPWLELLLGIFLVTGAFTQYIAWISLTLLAIFSLIAIIAVAKKIDIPCSCFGATSKEPLSLKTVLRNALLILLTLPFITLKQSPPLSLDVLLDNPANINGEDLALTILLPVSTVGLAVLILNAYRTLTEISKQR